MWTGQRTGFFAAMVELTCMIMLRISMKRDIIMPERVGIVLTGGRSSRFGSNKALALVEGDPMVVRVARTLKQVCNRVVLLTGEPGAYEKFGYEIFIDDPPFSGPAFCLAKAAHHFKNTELVVSSCDLPWLKIEILELLQSKIGESEACLFNFPDIGDCPLPGVYQSDALSRLNIPHSSSLKNLVGQLNPVNRLTAEMASVVDKDLDSFKNINFKSELDLPEKTAKPF